MCILLWQASGAPCSSKVLEKMSTKIYWLIAYPNAATGTTFPSLIAYTVPKYSLQACAAKWTGVVSVNMEISETGEAAHLAVAGSDDVGLGEATVEALKTWRFGPGTIEGRAVRSSAIAEFHFGSETGRVSMASPIRRFEPDWQRPPDPSKGPLVVGLIIDDQGRPRSVRALRTIGYPWDDIGVSAVMKWQFHPATLDGRPVPIQTVITISARPVF